MNEEPVVPETSSTERADALFDIVSEALRDHYEQELTEADLRRSMARGDMAFQELHDSIVAGGPLPSAWERSRTDRRPSDS